MVLSFPQCYYELQLLLKAIHVWQESSRSTCRERYFQSWYISVVRRRRRLANGFETSKGTLRLAFRRPTLCLSSTEMYSSRNHNLLVTDLNPDLNGWDAEIGIPVSTLKVNKAPHKVFLGNRFKRTSAATIIPECTIAIAHICVI